MPETPGNSLDQHTFRKLSRLYIIALSAIAVSVIISQVLIHQFLDDQENDSTVVNIAGRQRMLSQKLTKESLQLLIAEETSELSQLKNDIKSTLAQWKFSHYALVEGSDSLGLPGNNSSEIREMFEQIQPYFTEIEETAGSIVSQLEQDLARLKTDTFSRQELPTFKIERFCRYRFCSRQHITQATDHQPEHQYSQAVPAIFSSCNEVETTH